MKLIRSVVMKVKVVQVFAFPAVGPITSSQAPQASRKHRHTLNTNFELACVCSHDFQHSASPSTRQPIMDEGPARDRSASPERGEPKPKKSKSSGGFRWKEKRPRDDDDNNAAGNEGHRGLERGYRDRSPRRNDYRDRDRERERRGDDYRDRRGGEDNYHRQDSWRRGRDDEDRNRDRPRYSDRDRDPDSDRRPYERSGSDRRDQDRQDRDSKRKDRSKDKDKAAKPAAMPTGPGGEAMIIVNINDRLGTKAAIPCFASDSVKAFKAMVAAHIGRQPHEIMLKRQGERPFKDQLTLEDYGVSNGVQLDLELDTGD